MREIPIGREAITVNHHLSMPGMIYNSTSILLKVQITDGDFEEFQSCSIKFKTIERRKVLKEKQYRSIPQLYIRKDSANCLFCQLVTN